MNDLIPLRCSSLPLAAACMASQFHAGPVCESAGPEARLGSAVHECIGLTFDGHVPHVEEIAKRWAADAVQAEKLYQQALRCWQEMKGVFCG